MTATLGLIGAGRIGSALAKLALAAGIEVVVSNSRGPQTLTDLVARLGEGVRAADVRGVARAGDVVVATIPFGRHPDLPVAELDGKVVIDTMNYYPERDDRFAELDAQKVTSSQLTQRHLPGSRVVKAFNNIDFLRLEVLARPSGAQDRTALPIAGDDNGGKDEARGLLDRLGYDALDTGTLGDSWRSEPQTEIYVKPYLPDRPAELTDPSAVMDWFLQGFGVAVPADRTERLIRDTARQSPAEARESLG
ncbi:NAD(P)-binding domain-containing protein [Streptomyces sp. NPDC050264]|uniref:NADPH-dependent F420 reductase n=1 Tax=Streptomyces sp. NPDC050264 TaxID=3155038 RepID=UPI00342D20D4